MAAHEKSKKDNPADIFNDVDQHMSSLATQAATGDTASIEALKRRYSIIETLLNVSTSMNSTLNLQELLGKIIDSVIKITDTNRGALMLKTNGDLSLALTRSRDGKAISEKDFDLSVSVVQMVASTGEPQYISNALEVDDLKDKKSIVDFGIKTVIGIPLKFEENLVGVIYADSDSISPTFSPSDLSILNAFGSQAAVAIENTKRHGELELIRSSLEKQNVSLRQELAGKYEFSGIVGRSKAMQAIFQVVTKVAPLSTTVLVHGETGTGKELIAKAIHYNSSRKGQPIVSINCGALPKDILESELFGYRKGAFTGADQDRAGLFEAATGGTLFLDEIGEMAVELQVKLLRALQEGEIRRLGEDQNRAVDVRVIAATNKDLASEVEKGNFRKDLFYRLNVVPIYIPPLQEREEDVLALADHFLTKFSAEMNKNRPTLTRDAKELLMQHTWLGNVRELENAIERALALGEGKSTLGVSQFEHLIRNRALDNSDGDEPSLKSTMLSVEKEFIRKTLIRNSWNVSKSAGALKISRQQLHNKIKKLEISHDV